MGFKIFGKLKSSGKSEYYNKIEKMLQEDVTDAYFSVTKIHGTIRSKKKAKDQFWYKEDLDKNLLKFDSVIKQLMVELSQLKSKDAIAYKDIEKDFTAIRNDLTDVKNLDWHASLRSLGTVYSKIRLGISDL